MLKIELKNGFKIPYYVELEKTRKYCLILNPKMTIYQ